MVLLERMVAGGSSCVVEASLARNPSVALPILPSEVTRKVHLINRMQEASIVYFHLLLIDSRVRPYVSLFDLVHLLSLDF